MDLLKVAGTTALSLLALFLLTKLMGNKQVSQLSMFDYIVGITIGSIAAELATELENPEHSLLAMVMYAATAFLVSLVTGKSTKARKTVIGRPLILFDKGKLYRNNFKKARIDISDFLVHCRNQGYFDLSKVRTAVFEYNGSVSILPVETDRPLTPSDMSMNPTQQDVVVNVILDGHVNDVNLKHAGKNRVWLDRELHVQGYHSPSEIFLGSVNTVNNTLTLYAVDTGENRADPFE